MPAKALLARSQNIGGKPGVSVAGTPLSDTNERPDASDTLRDTSPFGHLWPEALIGEVIIERFLRGDGSFESSPIALMRALLVQTWRPFGANGRNPAGLGARHALSRVR